MLEKSPTLFANVRGHLWLAVFDLPVLRNGTVQNDAQILVLCVFQVKHDLTRNENSATTDVYYCGTLARLRCTSRRFKSHVSFAFAAGPNRPWSRRITAVCATLPRSGTCPSYIRKTFCSCRSSTTSSSCRSS